MTKHNHISIKDKSQCSGCTACAEVCPVGCIEMRTDCFGSSYPSVDESRCINCGKCLKTCPFINTYEPQEPIACYAAKNADLEMRLAGSSGGVFIALSKYIIENGGVVCGATFDENFKVKHTFAESIEDVYAMMGSKYVQSNPAHTLPQTKKHLESGRKVLYSGTPCQISGLNHYLAKNYENLITLEVICHGVPMPEIWHNYIKHNIEPNTVAISFRDKRQGWSKFGFSYKTPSNNDGIFSSQTENKYLYSFLHNWSLRPSCFSCKVKGGKSMADITLGDFWGITKVNSELFDESGVSCLILNSLKARSVFSKINSLITEECTLSQITEHNQAYSESCKKPAAHDIFSIFAACMPFNIAFYCTKCYLFFYKCVKYIQRRI